MANGDRSSLLKAVPEQRPLSPAEMARKETENGFRQYDRMVELIEEGLRSERFLLRPWMIGELNRLAVDGLSDRPGNLRAAPIEIQGSNHEPPDHVDVGRFVDEMCDYVNDNWHLTAVHLAAYVGWRLNWIHPFADGNGRTSRATAYLVLCVRSGCLLPGTKTLPDRIAEDKQPYYQALEDADRHWDGRCVDVSAMEGLFAALVTAQVGDLLRSPLPRNTKETPLPPTIREPAVGTLRKVARSKFFWGMIVIPLVAAAIGLLADLLVR